MKRPIALGVASVLAVLCALARPAPAAWDADGVPLCVAPNDNRDVRVAPDGMGGAIAVWSNPGTGWGSVFAQRVTSGGEIPRGWPADGVRLGQAYGAQFDPANAPAGDGGAFVAWQEYARCDPYCGTIVPRVRLIRLSADGSAASGWPTEGLEVAPTFADGLTQMRPALVLDGAGGVVIAWSQHAGVGTHEVRAQRFDANGGPLWSGAPEGVLVAWGIVNGAAPALATDGAGGVFIAWEDRRFSRHADVFAQRLDGAGSPRWVANGVAVAVHSGWQWDLQMVPDAAGDALLVWADERGGSIGIYGEVLHPDGPHCASCENIPLAVGTSDQLNERMVSDGAGGAILVWQRGGGLHDDVYAQHLDGTLAPLPGWPVGGRAVCALPGSAQTLPAVALDGPDGMTIVWSDDRSRTDVPMAYAIGLASDGTPLPGWPANGIPIAPILVSQTVQGIVPSPGGAIAVWLDERNAPGPSPGAGFDDLYAQRVAAPAVITAPQVTVTGVETSTESVRLEWSTADGAGLLFLVYRRTEAGDWTGVRWTTANAAGCIVHVDRAVTPRERYGYRLGFFANDGSWHFLGETWVTIPPPLSLRGASPNPSPNELVVSFDLPDAAPATLALFDLSGRQIESREVGALGAGAHTLRLAAERHLPAGVYLVRLTRRSQVFTARASVRR